MSLKSNVIKLLDDSIKLCKECESAEELAELIKSMRSRLDEPLRVAIVGMIKAGKSTLLNALMGADIVYTGTLETTYTVTWFKYGDTPSLKIYFNNGTTEKAEFADMKKWSVREYEKENPRINDVRYIVVYYPAEVLKKIEFIDTPGLNSTYGKDAKNTLDFLAVNGTKEDKDTIRYASEADAIVYAFNRSLAETDVQILKEFHHNFASSSPINSIGVLTRVDVSGGWDVYSKQSPTQEAMQVTETLMKKHNLNSLLYTIRPVTAKAVEGAANLSEREKAALTAFSGMDREDFKDCLSEAKNFADSTKGLYAQLGDTEVRRSLMEKLAPYGIYEATEQLCAGCSVDELQQILYEKCGIAGVNELLEKHFGGRTFIIKTKYILDNIKSAIRSRLAKTNDDDLRKTCGVIDNKISVLETSNQRMDELRIIQSYYDGRLVFNSADEKEDFLRITGEYGYSADKRLGIEGVYTLEDLRGRVSEKTAKWRIKAGEFMQTAAYRDAAEVIVRSYEMLYYHISALLEE